MKKVSLRLLEVGTVKDICKSNLDCTCCSLFKKGKGCPFEHYFPSKWELD